MDIQPIHTEADYKATLVEVSALMESDPALCTSEGVRLDVLITLIQAYEAMHQPINPPAPRSYGKGTRAVRGVLLLAL